MTDRQRTELSRINGEIFHFTELKTVLLRGDTDTAIQWVDAAIRQLRRDRDEVLRREGD